MSSRRPEDIIQRYAAQPAQQFDRIAFLYDDLMAGVPYSAWVDYIERIIRRFGCRPRRVLDLCCGTGSVGNLLARKGYLVTGVDASRPMIEIARRKAGEEGLSVDYRTQDARSLDLGSKFDLVISLFDSLNYILEPAGLQEIFDRVSSHLRSEGLLIFDLNTELALAGGFFNQNNVGSTGPVFYVWRSSYDSASRICRIDMKYLYKGGGSAEHIEVAHYQRAYDRGEMESMLSGAGLETLAVYKAYTFRKATGKADRVFFVARKYL